MHKACQVYVIVIVYGQVCLTLYGRVSLIVSGHIEEEPVGIIRKLIADIADIANALALLQRLQHLRRRSPQSQQGRVRPVGRFWRRAYTTNMQYDGAASPRELS